MDVHGRKQANGWRHDLPRLAVQARVAEKGRDPVDPTKNMCFVEVGCPVCRAAMECHLQDLFTAHFPVSSPSQQTEFCIRSCRFGIVPGDRGLIVPLSS